MGQQTRQLFGTDGIRGVAGEFPLTLESTYLIGRALGHDLVRNTRKAQGVVGQDTRQASAWIADRVAEGLGAVGVDVHSAGVITTPGIAYLARSRGFAAGVVISASHNPWTDNGIKVFSGDGFKLVAERERGIVRNCFAELGFRRHLFTFRPTAEILMKVAGRCIRRLWGKRWRGPRRNLIWGKRLRAMPTGRFSGRGGDGWGM